MLTLLHGAECFAPESLGKQDVLLGGGKILEMAEGLGSISGVAEIETLDLSGKWIVPGLVDSLVHITGGGGEGGFASRTPELNLSAAVKAGITTMVGALGTDSVTRTLSNLLAKARELQAGGIHCFCHTGSYHLPVKTLTDSLETDIVYIPEFIGVGEIAISDHRSSQPDVQSLAELAAQARVAGMVSGKAGIVSIHTGDGRSVLQPLLDVVDQSELPITQFYPTHINRNPWLFEAGIDYAKQGGYVDFTTSTTPEILASGETAAAPALREMLNQGVPLERITFSSDGNASLPLFDNAGRLSGLQVGQVSSLWQAVVDAIRGEKLDPADVLQVVTSNPADILKLDKGRLQTGGDADLLIVDATTLVIEGVISAGQWLMREGEVLRRGTFES